MQAGAGSPLLHAQAGIDSSFGRRRAVAAHRGPNQSSPRCHGGQRGAGLPLQMCLEPPFRVLDVEYLYGEPPRDHPEKGSPCVKAWIHVRRLTEDDYAADPGSAT